MQFMNTPLSSTFFNRISSSQLQFILVNLALVSGLALSIMSWLELCVEHCSANHSYRLLGLPFAFVGAGFFSAALILHWFSKTKPFFLQLVQWMIAMAFGSEIMFLIVQKAQIGHWCPVCLSIATTVAIAAIILSTNYFKQLFENLKNQNKGNLMSQVKQALSIFSLVLVGFFISFIGVSKVDASEAGLAAIKPSLLFGNKNSSVEVYFFSDWYCPSCKKIEPVIESTYPKIKSDVAFYFIDYAIHKNSLNYTPYDLAFQVHNKENYLAARQALMDLAEKNESPNDEDVIQEVKKKGLTLHELSFLDVKNGMEFFDKTVERFKLNSTPVIIVTTKQGAKAIKLEGSHEITEKNILKAIEQMKNNS